MNRNGTNGCSTTPTSSSIKPPEAAVWLEPRLPGNSFLLLEQRPQVILHLVETVFLAVGPGHVVTAGLVAEPQLRPQLRHSISFVEIHGLDGVRIWPTFEQPRRDGPGRRLDLQVGSPKRALPSVFGHEDDVVVPSNAEVDRALRHHIREWSEPVADVLRLRQNVEDEFERSV